MNLLKLLIKKADSKSVLLLLLSLISSINGNSRLKRQKANRVQTSANGFKSELFRAIVLTVPAISVRTLAVFRAF